MAHPRCTEHQLLELLLTFAIPRRDTNPLAHSLLAAYGSLDKVLAANPYDLMRQEGIGPQTAVLLSLAGALMQCRSALCAERTALNTPEAASRYCQALLAGAKYEETYVISLDKRRTVRMRTRSLPARWGKRCFTPPGAGMRAGAMARTA